jgi:hypothetical protein
MIFDKQQSMKQVFTILSIGFCVAATAQTTPVDTVGPATSAGKVTVIKDSRLDELAKKEAAFNEAMNMSAKSGKGYRLMVLSTNDRPMAMKVRAQLLQHYPDQKIYMMYQPPNIKLKFGDYVERADAENMRKDIIKSKIVTGNIYVVADKIEIKPDKNKEAGTDK